MTDLPPAQAPAAAMPVRLWGLLPCAGVGQRALAPGAQAGVPKQYQPLAGHPMVLHTLAAFAAVPRLAGTLVAVAPGDRFFAAHSHPAWFAMPCGGATRAEPAGQSVKVCPVTLMKTSWSVGLLEETEVTRSGRAATSWGMKEGPSGCSRRRVESRRLGVRPNRS